MHDEPFITDAYGRESKASELAGEVADIYCLLAECGRDCHIGMTTRDKTGRIVEGEKCGRRRRFARLVRIRALAAIGSCVDRAEREGNRETKKLVAAQDNAINIAGERIRDEVGRRDRARVAAEKLEATLGVGLTRRKPWRDLKRAVAYGREQ